MHFWGVKIGLFSELGKGVERSVVDYVKRYAISHRKTWAAGKMSDP